MQAEHLVVLHGFPVWLPQTQTWMYNQVRYLQPDVDCHIVCERTENLDQFGLPNIHCLWEQSRWRYLWDKGLRKLRLRRHLGFLVQQARRHGAQLLHSHFGNVGWRNLGAAKRAGIKHVVTFYGMDASRLPREAHRWYKRYQDLFDQVDLVLCEGPFMANSIIRMGCSEENVRVHHLGVAVREIEFRPREWKPVSPLRVLMAASFREKKGIPYALEALGHLQHDVPLEVTIIGDVNHEPRSQEEKKKILETIRKHNLTPKVRMLGYQPHSVLFEEAYRHHIFLSPSVTAKDGDTEGGAPVSLIEMAATGMPLVSTTHCDIPEIVQHVRTGLLAKERDVDGLVAHLRWMVEHPDRWREMLLAGRRHIEKEYDVKVQAKKMAGIYHEVLRG